MADRWIDSESHSRLLNFAAVCHSVTAWSRPTILIRRPSSLGGYPVAATSAVGVFAAARRAAHTSSDCWWPSIRCCRSDALEQSATWHYWLWVTDIILPETENVFVFYIISMTTFFSGSWGFYLGHFNQILMYVHCVSKKSTWLRFRR